MSSPALVLSEAATAQAEGDFGSALCRYPTKLAAGPALNRGQDEPRVFGSAAQTQHHPHT